MTEPTPIAPGVVVSVDGEREFADYLLGRLRLYCAEHGEPPHSAAVVLLSATGEHFDAHTWSNDPASKRYPVCATAAFLLTRLGLGAFE